MGDWWRKCPTFNVQCAALDSRTSGRSSPHSLEVGRWTLPDLVGSLCNAPTIPRPSRPLPEHLQRLGRLLKFVEFLQSRGLLFEELRVLVADCLQLFQRSADVGCRRGGWGL